MKATERVSVGAVVAVFALLGGAIFGTAAEAKRQNSGRARITKEVNLTIPNRVMGGPWGQLRSTIEVPKKYKGLIIGDVNVTFQALGSSAESAEDLFVRVSAPNGNTVNLFDGGLGQNVGPLTLDDETRVQFCNDPTPPCADPDDTLGPPYFGTARPIESLSHLNDGKMRGVWTLSAFDTSAMGLDTNTLGSWTLDVTAGVNTRKPV
jgi:hypothetical protein